jgi:hypothetical protein
MSAPIHRQTSCWGLGDALEQNLDPLEGGDLRQFARRLLIGAGFF